jgi:membrane protein DedA with SNARE-associated domain
MNFMIPTSFAAITQWILQQGYTVMFILMLIEGPVVTAAGAFAAAFSYFHLWIVFVLSILGNLIPDALFYGLGYWGRNTFIEKYGHYFGATKERVAIAEKLAANHTGKSIFAIKMIPFIAAPGLIVVGASRMDIRKYIFWCLAITIPSSLFYLLIGYYFGAAYGTIDHYLHLGYYLIGAVVIIVIAILYYQRKFTEDFARKIGEE